VGTTAPNAGSGVQDPLQIGQMVEQCGGRLVAQQPKRIKIILD